MIATLLATAADASAFDAVLRWAKVESAWELWLLAFGVLAQAVFFFRWIVQWLASERRGESHMPEAFWWLSLAGASMLFTYFVLRGEPVGMLGQSIGWVVYLRNLQLLRREKHAQDSDAVTDAATEKEA